MPKEHTQLCELVSAYALGCLDAGDAAAFSRHLETCAHCRADLPAFRGVADALLLAAPDARPSPYVRERLLALAGGGNASIRPLEPRPVRPAQHPPSPRPSRRAARPAWPVMALVALAAVVLGGLLLAFAARWAAPARAVALLPTDAAPAAAGELRFARDGAATLEVTGLPPLPAGRQYQLWLVAGDERASGAVFSTDANGWAAVPVAASRPFAAYERFGITIEPAGGSPGPTGERVLGSGG
ncbi:MAG: anti-sigma factor [Candidatus Promineofilum sp.]|nr:anti-sigma factor [Promineifilum sp.]